MIRNWREIYLRQTTANLILIAEKIHYKSIQILYKKTRKKAGVKIFTLQSALHCFSNSRFNDHVHLASANLTGFCTSIK